MSEPNDIDPFSAEALLSGSGADADHADIAAVLEALEAPGASDELHGADAVFLAATAPRPAVAKVTPLRRLTAKTGSVAAAAVITFGGVAAAAAGVPVVEDLVPGIGGGDEPSLVEVETEEVPVTSESPATTEAGSTEVEGDDGEHGARVSAAAQSDCGKKDKPEDEEETAEEPATPAVEVDCGDTEWKNHGEFVSSVARDKDGDGEPDVGKDQAPGQIKKAEREAAGLDGEVDDGDDGPGKGNAYGKSKVKPAEDEAGD